MNDKLERSRTANKAAQTNGANATETPEKKTGAMIFE